jgi:hypothetical protein
VYPKKPVEISHVKLVNRSKKKNAVKFQEESARTSPSKLLGKNVKMYPSKWRNKNAVKSPVKSAKKFPNKLLDKCANKYLVKYARK